MNYQERVSTRTDVRALYEKVIANPAIARYRGYTESKSYGWDEAAEDYIKKEGEVWFENPSYDAALIPEGEGTDSGAERPNERLGELEALVKALTEEGNELEQRAADAEARAKAAENERDEVKEALLELRRALMLVAELAGVK